MKRLVLLITLALIITTPALGQNKEKQTKGNGSGVEEQVQKLDRQWFDAVINNNAAGFENIEADDIVVIEPDGMVANKQQDVGMTRSGDLKIQSGTYDEARVRVYGDTAVITGKMTIKGAYKGQDFSGQFCFTDVYAKRNGRWQAVNAQTTPVAQPMTK